MSGSCYLEEKKSKKKMINQIQNHQMIWEVLMKMLKWIKIQDIE